MLTPAESRLLRRLLAREAAPAGHTAPAAIRAGAVIQIRPEADAHFGGMLAVITQADRYHLRGYPLRPHRGGCREAWLRWKPTDLVRIGQTYWPQLPEFALRSACFDPRCPAEQERLGLRK